MNKNECKLKLIEIIKTCDFRGLVKKLKSHYLDIYFFIDQFKTQNKLINIGESIFWILNDITEKPKCPAISSKCNKQELKFNTIEKGYQKYCIKCCTSTVEYREKYKKTMMERYNTDNPQKIPSIREKTDLTNINKYGTLCPRWSESGKEKSKNTLFKNYGPKGLANSIITERKIETNKQKYGTKWALQTEKIQDKRKNTCKKNYGSDNWMKSNEAKKLFQQIWLEKKPKFQEYVQKLIESRNLELVSEYVNAVETVTLKCKKCLNTFSIMWNSFQQGGGVCPTCFQKNRSSVAENEIYDLVISMGFKNIKKNDREIIKPLELDIVIEDKKIAIEYCGLWCHSSGGNAPHLRPQNYHLIKLQKCNDLGYQLITIFEDEWILKKDITISRIKNILGNSNNAVYARKCIVKEISFEDKKNFLNTNHIQGDTISKINLGLYYNDLLVSVMTFSYPSLSKGQKNKDTDIYELSRFSSLQNYNCVGAASKLLSFFKNKYQWKIIFSYCDRRWSSGNLYTKIGFQKIKECEPNYWYWGKKIQGRSHRFNFRKTQLKKFISYSDSLTEKEIMSLEGYAWIYDCGNLKFIMENKKTI